MIFAAPSIRQALLAHAAASAGDDASTLLGASLYRWHDAAVIDPTGAPGGRFRWTDRGPNGFHADAAGAADAPTAGADIEGQPALSFNGSSSYLTTTETLEECRLYHDAAQRVTLWIVDEMTAAVNTYLGGTNSGPTTNVGLNITALGSLGSRTTVGIANGSAQYYLGASTNASAGLARCLRVIDYDAAELRLQVHTPTQTLLANDPNPIGSPAALVDPTTRFEIGRRPGLGLYYGGKIAEWVVAVDATDEQIQSLCDFYHVKYGLTG